MEALMGISLQTTQACLEKTEANQGKVEIKMEACLEETKVETIGALADRYGDRRLVVRHRGHCTKRTEGDGGSRPKLAPARGRLTSRAVPALRKGRSRWGLGKTTGNGIRGRSRRQELRLGSRKAANDALGQTLELEVVKRVVGISIRLRKVSECTLWRRRPLPKRRKRRQKHRHRRRNGGIPVG
jgi:hypothetical protein